MPQLFFLLSCSDYPSRFCLLTPTFIILACPSYCLTEALRFFKSFIKLCVLLRLIVTAEAFVKVEKNKFLQEENSYTIRVQNLEG